jgi:hypothetical protein
MCHVNKLIGFHDLLSGSNKCPMPPSMVTTWFLQGHIMMISVGHT